MNLTKATRAKLVIHPILIVYYNSLRVFPMYLLYWLTGVQSKVALCVMLVLHSTYLYVLLIWCNIHYIWLYRLHSLFFVFLSLIRILAFRCDIGNVFGTSNLLSTLIWWIGHWRCLIAILFDKLLSSVGFLMISCIIWIT